MIIVLALGFILGLVLGSLVDCIAGRSLSNESFWTRSYCDHCKKVLAWYDLFPLFSYFWNKGRCSKCKKKLSIEYPLVELITGIFIAILFYYFLPVNFLELNVWSQIATGADLLYKTFIVCILLIVLITDIKKGLIPDRITYPAVLISFIYLVLITIYKSYLLYISLLGSAVGKYLLPPNSDYFLRHVIMLADPLWIGVSAAVAIGLFFLILILVTKGRGMGGGDMKLGIFLGLVFGFPQGVVVLMLAFLLGSIFGIALIIFGKKKFGQTIPFGPFLSLAGIASLYWGEMLFNYYIKLMS